MLPVFTRGSVVVFFRVREGASTIYRRNVEEGRKRKEVIRHLAWWITLSIA